MTTGRFPTPAGPEGEKTLDLPALKAYIINVRLIDIASFSPWGRHGFDGDM